MQEVKIRSDLEIIISVLANMAVIDMGFVCIPSKILQEASMKKII